MIEALEREVIKAAKDLNINEKYIQRILDGDYRAITLTKNSSIGKVMILLKLPDDDTGKKTNLSIKVAKDYKHEIITKMEKFVRLVRLYRSLKKAKEIEEKVKEDLAVSLVS